MHGVFAGKLAMMQSYDKQTKTTHFSTSPVKIHVACCLAII